MRIAELLRLAREQGVARLDAQLLLAHRLQRPRVWLLAHDDEPVDAAAAAAFAQDLTQRAAGMPLAYLVGEREFHGLMLHVSPAVLVPRPETELLVDWALALLEGPLADITRPTVIDLGTGSGAIALALKTACQRIEMVASDCSAQALAVAQINAQKHGLVVEFRLGDWWSAVGQDEMFDLVVSNPPYIAGQDAHLEALGHEPRLALTPEGDGLGALRSIIAGAAPHLRPGGWLLLEHGYDQASAVQRLLTDQGLQSVSTRQDLAGKPRCTAGARLADALTPIAV